MTLVNYEFPCGGDMCPNSPCCEDGMYSRNVTNRTNNVKDDATVVNSDKWEKIPDNEIKVGDKIKVIVRYPDGVVTVSTGVARHAELSWWSSKDGRRLVNVSNNRTYTPEVYRRKPKPVKLPTRLGAIISARDIFDSKETLMVFDGLDWAMSDGPIPDLRVHRDYKDIRILSKGPSKKKLARLAEKAPTVRAA